MYFPLFLYLNNYIKIDYSINFTHIVENQTKSVSTSQPVITQQSHAPHLTVELCLGLKYETALAMLREKDDNPEINVL